MYFLDIMMPMIEMPKTLSDPIFGESPDTVNARTMREAKEPVIEEFSNPTSNPSIEWKTPISGDGYWLCNLKNNIKNILEIIVDVNPTTEYERVGSNKIKILLPRDYWELSPDSIVYIKYTPQ